MSDLNKDINAELLEAVKKGEFDKVKSLISEGADVNAYDGSQGNSLYWAVKNDHLVTAKVLLDNGADLFAFGFGRERHVSSKYEKVKAEHCKVSLHLAARLGNLEAVKDLLGKGADVNAQNDKEETPLHFAATHGHKEIVDALLEVEGIDVNAKDQDGNTPLHRAAKKGYTDIVNTLLEKGADVDAKNDTEETPFDLADDKIKSLLKSVKEANDKLLKAAKSGNIDDVENLLGKEGKAQVNTKYYFGNTPLHWAAENGHKDVVEFLFSKGAKVDAKNGSQSTPLHFAAESRYKDTEKIVEFLLDKGADVNPIH